MRRRAPSGLRTPASRAVRLHALALGAALLTPALYAQTPPSAPEAPAAGAGAYVDRVMESPPEDDPLLLKATPYDESGWSRGWRVDAGTTSQKGFSQSRNQSLGLSGFVDTPDYGIFSATANLVQAQDTVSGNPQLNASGSSFRIDQRALPLNGGWRADHSVGDINTGNTPLARGIGRVSLPSAPIRGLGGQWTRGDEISLNASEGQSGVFNGLDLSGFNQTGGRIMSAGGQMRLDGKPSGSPAALGRFDGAFQVIDARGLPFDFFTGARQDTQSVFTSAAWEGAAPWAESMAGGYAPVSERRGGLRLQGNIVGSYASVDGGARGIWGDAAWRTDRWRQTAGVFRFDPNLRWGAAVLASDLKGVYWQADTATRQWQFGFNSELSDAVSGRDAKSAYVSSYGSYRIDSRNGITGSVSLRALSNPAQSVMLSYDRTSALGQTQWRSDVVHATGLRTVRFGADHIWPLAAPATFTTSLAWERLTSDFAAPVNGWVWGVLGSLSPFANVSLDGSLRGTNRGDGSTSLIANVAASLNLQQGWSLSLRYTESRGQEPQSTLLTSALSTALTSAFNANTLRTQDSRSVQLLLTYQGRAGTSSRPLGGLPGGGAGSISGTVFFDADNNGRREASEGGVPGVTVILDKRYVTRTDAQGRYEFAYVATGDHVIEVSADNVPLPWSPVARDPVKATVLVRDATTQDFAVQRDR
jgi:SdrD B-like domain